MFTFFFFFFTGVHPDKYPLQPFIPGSPTEDLRLRSQAANHCQAGLEASLVQGKSYRRRHRGIPNWHGPSSPGRGQVKRLPTLFSHGCLFNSHLPPYLASLGLWIDGCLFQGVIIINTWMGWIGVFVHIDWENDDNDVYWGFFSHLSPALFSAWHVSGESTAISVLACHDECTPPGTLS